MRLKLVFKPPNGSKVSLPVHYNQLIQGFIYNSLDKGLSAKIHDFGFIDPITGRKFKLFTFSRIIFNEKPIIKDKRIYFSEDLSLYVASPIKEFIHSLANSILLRDNFYIGNEEFTIQSLEVISIPEYKEKVYVKTLSPITVYSTLEKEDGKKKTYYYNPSEDEFETLIIQNLNKKLRTLKKTEELHGSVKPYRINPTQKIIKYKDTVIKGWDGIFELSLPKELFNIAFTCGLGSKNSQGFGYIEMWEEKSK